MSSFSNYLEETLKNKNISIKQFAKECNLSLSEARGFVYGKVLPDDFDIVHNICDTFHFSIYERQHITESYIEATKGTDIMKAFQIMEHVVYKTCFSPSKKNLFLPPLTYKEVAETNVDFMLLNSKKELHEAIKYALEFALSKGYVDVFAYMRPEEFIYNMLIRFFDKQTGNGNITLHQIFCFNSTPAANDTQNIRSVNELLYIILSDMETDIAVYHNNISHKTNEMSILPFMININDITIYMNFESNTGYFIKDSEYGDFMRKIFLRIREKCKIFADNITFDSLIEKVAKTNSSVFSICDFPIVCRGDTAFYPQSSGNFIFSGQQFENFLKNGIVTDICKTGTRCIDENTRYNILKQLLLNAKAGRLKIFFTKEAYPVTPGSGIITTSSDFYIIKRDNAKQKVWHFEDSRICRLFENYFAYHIDMRRTYTAEESIKWLETLLTNHNNS